MAYGQKRGRKPIYDASTGEPPTPEQVEKMQKQAWNVITYWLGQSDQPESFLREKLAKKGHTQEVIDDAMNKASERGWIDDERYARNFIEYRLSERMGATAIRFKLRNKGVNGDLVNELLNELVDEDEALESARSLAETRKRSLMSKPTRDKKVSSLAGFLARRGYHGGIVFKVASEAVDAWEAEEER